VLVKIQKSIVTTHKRPQVLVYNKDKSVMWEGDLTKEVEALMKNETKAYFEAKLEGTKVVIGSRVSEQCW